MIVTSPRPQASPRSPPTRQAKGKGRVSAPAAAFVQQLHRVTLSPSFCHTPRNSIPVLLSPFVTLFRRVFAVPQVAVQDFGPKMATEPRSGTDRHGSAPSGARPELATWPFAGSALRRGSRIPPFRARTRFRGHFRAFFAHADTNLSGSPNPPSRPPQPRGEPPRM